MDIIASGTTTGTVTLTMRTLHWKIINHTAANITVVFDSRYTVTIPQINTSWVDIPGDYQSITVSGGQIDYIVFG